MLPACIYADDGDVDNRLAAFGVTRQELVEVVKAVVAERANAVENDPVSAEGLFAYIYGTRNLRSLFRSKGYLLHRKENIEAVRHPDRDLRVVYQSVDRAASTSHAPQAVSGKGSGADRMIHNAQVSLFPEEVLDALQASKIGKIDTGVWFFCVSVNGDEVHAELSLPSGVEGGNFKGFLERIFIVRDGEWENLLRKRDGDAGAADFEPVVSRK